MIAFAKLQDLIRGRPITFPGQQIVNGLLFAALLAGGIAVTAGTESTMADVGAARRRFG